MYREPRIHITNITAGPQGSIIALDSSGKLWQMRWISKGGSGNEPDWISLPLPPKLQYSKEPYGER